jgi:hypothetical protein
MIYSAVEFLTVGAILETSFEITFACDNFKIFINWLSLGSFGLEQLGSVFWPGGLFESFMIDCSAGYEYNSFQQ